MKTAKKRVLFVDDDEAILGGLCDRFHRDRATWDMEFVSSGERALAASRAEPFDAVVTDMRMPVMDGARLLGIIKDEHPATVRIVLSGASDRDEIARALTSMHLFISKPCGVGDLRTAITRCLGAVEHRSDTLRGLIGRLDRVPTPPSVYLELSALAADPRSTVPELARLVCNDPALAAKTLQLANSAGFGASRAITSIEQSVSRIGIDMLRCLALGSSVFGDATDLGHVPRWLATLHASALRVALLAHKLVDDRRDADTAFAAALLHDIGQAVLAVSLPTTYPELHLRASQSGEPLAAVERRELGATHADVGGALLAMWGLPASITDVVSYHHDPQRAPAPCHGVLAAVHAADTLVRGTPVPAAAVGDAFLECLGLDGNLDAWRARAERR